MMRWKIYEQSCKSRYVAPYLAQDASPIVRCGKKAVLGRMGNSVAILNTTHDSDMAVPSTVDTEVPRRVE